MRHDTLSDMFACLKNAEAVGKKGCLTPASRLVESVLKVMQRNKYIGDFKFIDDGKGGRLEVKLLGKMNGCNAIRPRFSVKRNEFIKWEKRYLPASDIGILILTTPKGIMDHHEAKKEETGGKLLGYVY